jgi:ornithine cyclodeaminase/alanine dehydrogenase-like protein (mu-crystallin family)
VSVPTIDTPQPPRYVTAAEVVATLGFAEAADALATGLAGRSPETLDPTPRTALDLPSEADATGAASARELLLMPCHGPEGVGVKLVTIAHANPELRGLPRIQGTYVLFSADGLTPRLIIDGAALTRLRTAAVSALATRLLSRPDSTRLVIFGAGVQGAAHAAAVRAVRPIEEVVVIGASPESARATALVERLTAEGLRASLGDRGAVAEADIVCTCTTSSEPLFAHDALRPGTHVNAIGSYRPEMCELPVELLGEALLVVETEAAARAEAGEIVRAIDSGILTPAGFAAELGAVAAGPITRRDAAQITVFKSVGLSVEDLIVARALADRLGD